MNVSRETSTLMGRSDIEVLLEGASELNIDVNDDQAARLLDYQKELRRWNEKINLIGPGQHEEQVVIHLVDSLAALKFIPETPLDVLDLGSGAGLPGVVMAIMRPRWRVTMAEARTKRADFIRHVVRRLGIENAEVDRIRIGKERPVYSGEAFDLATFRALGHLKDVLPLVMPYVRASGKILAYKGPGGLNEWAETETIIAGTGLRLVAIEEIVLPFLDRKRIFLFFQRPGR